MSLLFWWPLAAATLHIVEEFGFPGGFAAWDRVYRSAYRASITSRLHLVMNAMLILACVAVGSAGPTPHGVAAWLTLAALLASNAVFHLVGTIKTRSYSPGLVTGLLLYVPMAVVGYAHFLRTHEASTQTACAAAAIGGSYHLWSAMAHARRARRAARLVALGILAIGLASRPTPATAATSPDRVAAMIETFMPWAIEGRDLPADPPRPAPALPHRSCGGRLDPQHLPETVYVSWDLSAEAQHAACNWKYDVKTRRATPLAREEADDVTKRVTAGTIPSEERAFFHSVPQRDGQVKLTAGYCWGSAIGTFAFREGRPVLVGELAIHGY